ncbi:hypothetical protein WMF37_30155 [Sorangium sp. So ce291]|uniref:hypothetical protein n=1 Tax=Sorangium sp. So ce291 TaxID=3133294 RepID=UPI003F6364EB
MIVIARRAPVSSPGDRDDREETEIVDADRRDMLDGVSPLNGGTDPDGESDEEEAARIAEEEGENRYMVLADRFGWSRGEIRDRFLDPYNADAELLELLNDEVGCSNEELGLASSGEPEDD